MVRRHVLRNALLPTIAVIATQIGYLIGGLVIVEVLFNYQGIGLLIFNAAKKRTSRAEERRVDGRGSCTSWRRCSPTSSTPC